jgi:hypothetical protein
VGGIGLEVDLLMKSVELLDRALRDANTVDSVEMTCCRWSSKSWWFR